jgi:hypothetical protein
MRACPRPRPSTPLVVWVERHQPTRAEEHPRAHGIEDVLREKFWPHCRAVPQPSCWCQADQSCGFQVLLERCKKIGPLWLISGTIEALPWIIEAPPAISASAEIGQ